MKTGGGQQPLVGSSPTASAFRGHGPTGRRWLRKPEIRVRIPVTPLEWHSPVVQRQRRLVHTQETMVRLHPGLLDCPGTPIGRAAWLKPRRMRVRLRPWARPGRQVGRPPWLRTTDAVGSSPTWAIGYNIVLVEQPGVLACLSRRRSRVQIPSRALSIGMARYANRQSGQAQTLVIAGSSPACATAKKHASAGHRRAQLPVKQPARKAMQVQLLPGALDTARSSIGTGRWPLKPERRVRFPHGPL